MIMTKRLTLIAILLAVASCSPTASRMYLKPQVTKKKVVDATSEIFDPKADILFVVDNSASMDTHQRNLATNIGLFTSVFLNGSILDWNVGVLSTDTTNTYYNNCCGQLYGKPRVVNKQTPNVNVALGQNIKMGTGGDGYEKAFDPVYLALQPQMLAGWNQGFLRDDAALIVIFITDAEDQSTRVSPSQFYDFLVKLKGGDKRKVLSFGAIIPSGVTNCTRDPALTPGYPAPEPKRIESFLELVDPSKSNVLSLCATDYGTRLAQFATDIVNQVSSTIYLSRAPAPNTLRVTYGDSELPHDYDTGWSYEPSTNAIHLGKHIDWASQPTGSTIQVFYEAARFDEE